MDSWSTLSEHGRVRLFLDHDLGRRPPGLAPSLDATARSAHGILADLTVASCIGRHRDGRRGRCQPVAQQFPDPITREKIFREALALLPGVAGQPPAEGWYRC